MIYLDHGATSMGKPDSVAAAMCCAVRHCGNPGRSGHRAAEMAARTVYRCRERAGELFDCPPERIVFTGSCTHSLNIALMSLIRPGDRVVISGFEHNAVTRLLCGLGAEVIVAGRRLFDWEDTLESFRRALDSGANAAVFTHMSNVFGYILPVQELSALCRSRGIPFVVDAAQSAGKLPVSLEKWGAAFIAMPGHKGLLGPQGTGLLLCGAMPQPLLLGGTGSESADQQMPDFLPDRCEAGTLNVPGIAGLSAGLKWLQQTGMNRIHRRECREVQRCAAGLEALGLRCFSGPHQGGTLSFVPRGDCEEVAAKLARQGIAVRAGLHCAPLAHESAGTLETGTVRISYGPDACPMQTRQLLAALGEI